MDPNARNAFSKMSKQRILKKCSSILANHLCIYSMETFNYTLHGTQKRYQIFTIFQGPILIDTKLKSYINLISTNCKLDIFTLKLQVALD